MGGDFLPKVEREKFLSNGYEEISGWTIDQNVSVIVDQPGNVSAEYRVQLCKCERSSPSVNGT